MAKRIANGGKDVRNMMIALHLTPEKESLLRTVANMKAKSVTDYVNMVIEKELAKDSKDVMKVLSRINKEED